MSEGFVGTMAGGVVTCDCGWKSEHYDLAINAAPEFAVHAYRVHGQMDGALEGEVREALQQLEEVRQLREMVDERGEMLWYVEEADNG